MRSNSFLHVNHFKKGSKLYQAPGCLCVYSNDALKHIRKEEKISASEVRHQQTYASGSVI